MSANIVSLRREPDLRPCDAEYAPVIDTRFLAVHMGNASASSALDGYVPRKVRHISAGTVIALAILGPAAIALAVSFGRWWLQ